VDEEGGLVQRLEGVFGEFDSAAAQAAEPATVFETAVERAEQLAEAGFNVDFAPVVDLRDPASESVIGTRSYGSDPATVTMHAGAMAKALRESGVTPTFKHFPGHGRASGDSHDGLVATPPLDDLLGSDLVPYRTLTRSSPSMVMMGHLEVPGLTEVDQPASLSEAAYGLLRADVGFDGVAITDDLAAMKAITDDFQPHEAAIAALAAGADIVLYTDAVDFDDVVAATADAMSGGALSEARIDEAITRIRRLLGCSGPEG
jgi:beta-N-acetylhexosaminidase